MNLPHSVIRAVLAAACLAAAVPAGAYQMTPMSLELGPADRAASGTIRLVNDGAEPVAIQVQVVRRSVAADGVETLEPQEGEIQVFPAQVVVPAGKSQSVRIKWNGPARIDAERSYRIVAEQLPVNLQRARVGTAQVDIMLRYLGTLYVVPDRAQPVVAAAEARVEKLGADAGLLRLTVRNTGAKHAILGNPRLQILEQGRLRTLAAAEVGALNGANVPAGKERHFAVSYSGPNAAGEAEVRLTFENP